MPKLYIDICHINGKFSSSIQSRKKLKKLQHYLGLTRIKQRPANNREYSVSHSHEYVIVASYINKIGIDIELINKIRSRRAEILSDEERQLIKQYGFTCIWVLKEAIAKYHTTGLIKINTIVVNKISAYNVTYSINTEHNKKVNILEYKFIDIDSNYRLCVVTKNMPDILVRVNEDNQIDYGKCKENTNYARKRCYFRNT